MLITAIAAGGLLIWLCRIGRLEKKWLILLLLLDLTGAVLTISEQTAGEKIPVSSIPSASLEEAGQIPLDVETDDGQTFRIEVDMPERVYTTAEKTALIQTVKKALPSHILGENLSFSHIENNLNLITSLADSPVEIQWYSGDPDIIGFDGVICPGVPDTGTEVTITADLTLQDHSDTWQQTITVYPSKEPLLLRDEILQAAEAENSRTAARTGVYHLPEQAGGKQLSWFRTREKRGILLSLLALAGGILSACAMKERRARAMKERQEQLMQDFPELISYLLLYFGAGLGTRASFRRIAAKYQKELAAQKQPRFAYEEVRFAVQMMENGKTELEAYEEFGSRCGIPCYRSLALLLSQNLRRGSAGITAQLEQEMQEAYEMRRRTARAEGEKTTIRLLLPMSMMLAVVMALILIPAFMSF